MAVKTDILIKADFETNDVPDQPQYVDLIDSKRNVLDEIPQSDVEKLAPLSQVISGSGSIVVPANSFILAMALIPASSGAFTIGQTGGATDYDGGDLTLGTNYTLSWVEYVTPATTIFFTGNFTVQILIR